MVPSYHTILSHFDLTDSYDAQITLFTKETNMEYFPLVTYIPSYMQWPSEKCFPLIVLFGIHPHEQNQINCLYYFQGFRGNIDAYLEDLKFITASPPPHHHSLPPTSLFLSINKSIGKMLLLKKGQLIPNRPGGQRIPPFLCISYIDICYPKGYGFLVWKWVWILTVLVWKSDLGTRSENGYGFRGFS